MQLCKMSAPIYFGSGWCSFSLASTRSFLFMDGRCEWLLVLWVLVEAASGTENASLLSD